MSAGGFCYSKYATTVPAWSEPFATITFNTGSKTWDYGTLLYNPFKALPSNVDDCLVTTYFSMSEACNVSSVEFSIADITPRYDSSHIYYPLSYVDDFVWPTAPSPRDVYAWVNNLKSPSDAPFNAGKFVKD